MPHSDGLSSEGLRALVADLERELAFGVRADAMTRAIYATDASIYEVQPLAVTFPKDADEVAAVVSVARSHGVPVLARGGGTSLAGQTQPTDLIKYGLIPEFVGRLPVVASLHDLDQAALIEILTQPKNAIVRQYQRLFDYENVKLRFTDDALVEIAELAKERKIGARGLRMIIEDLMLDLMYDLPSNKKVRECVVTREVVRDREKPITLVEKAG